MEVLSRDQRVGKVCLEALYFSPSLPAHSSSSRSWSFSGCSLLQNQLSWGSRNYHSTFYLRPEGDRNLLVPHFRMFQRLPLVLLNSSHIILNNEFIKLSLVSPLEYAICFLLGLSSLGHYVEPPFHSDGFTYCVLNILCGFSISICVMSHALSYHKTTSKPNLIMPTWLAIPEESDGIYLFWGKTNHMLFYSMLYLKNTIQHYLSVYIIWKFTSAKSRSFNSLHLPRM